MTGIGNQCQRATHEAADYANDHGGDGNAQGPGQSLVRGMRGVIVRAMIVIIMAGIARGAGVRMWVDLAHGDQQIQ